MFDGIYYCIEHIKNIYLFAINSSHTCLTSPFPLCFPGSHSFTLFHNRFLPRSEEMPCVALLTHSAVTCNIHSHSCFLFPCGFLLSVLKVKVTQSCPTLWRSHGLYSPQNSPEYWSGQPVPSPGDLPNLRIEPRSPTLQADSLPAEPQGMPKTTGVGSLFLLQQIYPNPGIELGSPALLEKEMTTHSSILVWRIPWTEEPGRLQSLGFQRVRHD